MERYPEEFELFCKNKLFHAFTDDELKDLFLVSKKLTLDKGDVLFNEGEIAHELFVIIKGGLEIVKQDESDQENYSIDILHAGDSVGEISLVDKEARSATVKAKTKTELRSITFKELEKIISRSPHCSKIYLHFSKNISRKLRNTNTNFLNILKTRITMGIFIVNIITVLCLFTYFMGGLQYLINIVPNTSYIVLPMTVGFAVLLLIMMKLSKLRWSEFGITFSKWKQATFDGFFLPIPILILGVLLKILVVRLEPDVVGSKIFDPFAMIENPANHTWSYWVLLNSTYWFIIVPMQELIVRGGVQGLLVHFITGKYRTFMSIVISNMIYSTLHLFMGIQISLVVFFVGMYIGWIYSRTNNLISCTIAHAILGTLALSVLGVQVYNTPK